MEVLDIKFWAGTEDSLQRYLLSVKQFIASTPTDKMADLASYGDQAPAPRLFSKQGNVGVISIYGSLNNTDSWMNKYIGASGYPEIRAALVYAAKDPDIKSVVLDVKSGGGAVSGMMDTAELIQRINADVKPVYAYSDGIVASAAYALGSSARELAIGKTTEAGSIGVLLVHQEMTKMMEDAGITPTVIRSGKFKALGNSYEKLSDLGKEVLQQQVDATAEVFNQLVADNRSVSKAVVDNRMGQGRLFMGQEAVDAGLADEVTNFDKFMSKVMGGIDSQIKSPKYGANPSKGLKLKTALTESDIAALAAGGAVAEDDAAKTEAELAAEAEAAAAAAKAAEADKPAAEGAKPEAGVQAQLDLLQAQLTAATDKTIAQAVELSQLKAASEGSGVALGKFRAVVQAVVGNQRVALGGSRDGIEALSDESLVAEHGSLETQLKAKFKAGGVAASAQSTTADKGAKQVQISASRRARIAATRLNQQ